MEYEKLNIAHNDDSFFSGAIFMSNRATKLECLQRKLFGLPHSKAKFLNQVKSGMFLFLFEHEERKLYGLFQATSDGALNIVPDAFRSTGQMYPAQILFKRIWMCKPLCEDEFRSAIAGNYYSPNKFHFGLSYGQVKSLIYLFYSKKIDLKQHSRPMIPRVIDRPANSVSDKVRLTEMEAYIEHEYDEYSREGICEVRKQYELPDSSMNPPIHYQIHATNVQHVIADTGQRLSMVNPPHSYFEAAKSRHYPIYHPDNRTPFDQLSIEKQHSVSEGTDYPKPFSSPSGFYMTNLGDINIPYNPDAPEFKLPLDNMTPRMVKVQEPDAIRSSYIANEVHPQSALLQHGSVYGTQPNQLIEFPDYIPLPEDILLPKEPQESFVNDENLNNIPFRSAAGNADELNAYTQMEEGDYNEDFVAGRARSDSGTSRASVFSRLSRVQNENPESSMWLTIEQVFNDLATKGKRWSTMKVPKHLPEFGSNAHFDSALLTESFGQNSRRKSEFSHITPQRVNRSNDDKNEDIPKTEIVDFSGEEAAEVSFELPFYNFQRRTTSEKVKVHDETATKNKRRRILRPLFDEVKQNTKEAEISVSAQTQTNEEAEVNLADVTNSQYENESQANCGNIMVESNLPGVQTLPEPEIPAETTSEHPLEIQANCSRTSVGNLPGVQTSRKSEIPDETSLEQQKNDSPESNMLGFQTHEKSEIPVETILEQKSENLTNGVNAGIKSDFPGFLTCRKSAIPAETKFLYKTESQANCVTAALESEDSTIQTNQKFESEDEPVEATPAVFSGTEDYIPLD